MTGLILVLGVAIELKPWIIFIALILGLISDCARS